MAIVTSDAYTWQVTYEDTTSVPEFEGVGTFGRGWAEVDQARVKRLTLVGQGREYSVHIRSGAIPVFFRRRSLTVGIVDGGQVERKTIHCIGWKREQDAVYLFVWDDGSTLLTDDLQAV